jgi:hypothetical protein
VAGGRHGAIYHVWFEEWFITLDVHNHRVGRQVPRRFRKTVRSTLMVGTGHDDFASEFPDGIGNAFVVGRNEDALDGSRALNAPVNVFYQRLALNFKDRFTGETGGLESCWDNRYSAFEFHVYAESVIEKMKVRL